MPHLLKYTSIIHLSNRSGGKSHTPTKEGNINIERFLNSLKTNNWNGDIFLEYGISYKDKLLKDLEWTKNFFEEYIILPAEKSKPLPPKFQKIDPLL